MSSTHTYVIYGPGTALKRLPVQLFEKYKPKYAYKYDSESHNDIIWVSVFEEYEKQINASLTLTCIFTFTGSQMAFECQKTGGRIGFRGSSLDDGKETVEDSVIKFIHDYAQRFGLSVQQENKQQGKENNSKEEE